jgi:threonine dehydratase
MTRQAENDVGLKAPTLADVHAAAQRIASDIRRTPLIRLDADAGGPEIWLKLENLQPIGSFKLRGALNRMRSLGSSELADGAFTASAGNMAQGVAYAARLLGAKASVVVPDTAPATKLEAIERLGGTVIRVPYEEWWDTMRSRRREGMRGIFVHPFADVDVMAGNGTIALEILEDLPEVDTVLVPWGGGGLACGIAAAARALNPAVRVYACEVEGAAPLAASIAAGAPVAIENRKTFVDGIGGRGVFPEMWPLAQSLVAGALLASVADVATAVRLLAQRARIVAEGAGATPVAIARGGLAGVLPRPRRVACIVSGGNIDLSVLATILAGKST